jgi:YihY family inner membrane protein
VSAISTLRVRERALDRYQREHAWLGFPLAVRQKYSDDGGGYQAAMLTFYGFYAIFPLLLAFVSVLGFVLHGYPKFERSIVNSALGQLPIIGRQLQTHSLQGTTLGLAVGLAGALWAGMGVFLAAQRTMNQLWGIPLVHQPTFVMGRLRALGLLGLLGSGVVVATALGGLATVGASYGFAWKVGAVLLSTALDIGLFWVAFRMLTVQDVSWRSLRGGAIAAGVAYEVLQLLGGVYVNHVLKHSSGAYGTFALVLGLLSWLYLAAQVVLLAAEGNVVAEKRLWPRSFSLTAQQPATTADDHALTLRTGVEQRRSDEQIEVTLDPEPQRGKANGK